MMDIIIGAVDIAANVDIESFGCGYSLAAENAEVFAQCVRLFIDCKNKNA